MPDPTDIELKLKTTGDTTGADEVKKSLFAVEDAAKDASRQADVDIVKGKQAAAVQREQAASLAQIAEFQQRIVAGQLAQAVGKISESFKGMSPEVDLALDATQNFFSTLATTGNPVAALLAVTATAVGGVVTAYTDAGKKIKAIAKEEKADLKELADLRRQFAAQIRAENLTAFFQKELDALDEQEKTLERIVRITASERALAAQQQAAAGTAAVAAGASPQAVAAGQQATSTNNEVAALKQSLEQSKLAVAVADDAAGKLELLAKTLAVAGNDAESAAAAATEATAARLKAGEVAREEAANQAVILNEMATANSAGKQAVEAIAKEGREALTESVKQERDAIQAEVTRLGANATTGAKATLEILNKILVDGKVSADELGKLAEAQGRMNGMTEKANAAVAESMATAEKNTAALLETIQPLLGVLDQQTSAIAILRQAVINLEMRVSQGLNGN